MRLSELLDITRVSFCNCCSLFFSVRLLVQEGVRICTLDFRYSLRGQSKPAFRFAYNL